MIINTIYSINKSTMVDFLFIVVGLCDSENLHITKTIWSLSIIDSLCNIDFDFLDIEVRGIWLFIFLKGSEFFF